MASTSSGTKVTCVGFISKIKLTNLSIGLPSILNSFLTDLPKSIASL